MGDGDEFDFALFSLRFWRYGGNRDHTFSLEVMQFNQYRSLFGFGWHTHPRCGYVSLFWMTFDLGQQGEN